MLPVSLACVVFCFSLSCVPYVASFSVFLFGFSLSCVKTKQNTTERNWQHRIHKTKKNKTKHNPEKLAT
jgi:flagellar biosynthesis component FlhA